MISTKTIYSSLILKGGREVGRKEEKERERKDKRKKNGKTGKKNTFFFPVCKKEGNSEVSANNVINRLSLY